MCAKVVQQPEMIIFSKHLILIQVFQPPNIQNMHFIPITTQKQLTNSQNEKGNQRIKSQKFNLPKKHSIFLVWFLFLTWTAAILKMRIYDTNLQEKSSLATQNST